MLYVLNQMTSHSIQNCNETIYLLSLHYKNFEIKILNLCTCECSYGFVQNIISQFSPQFYKCNFDVFSLWYFLILVCKRPTSSSPVIDYSRNGEQWITDVNSMNSFVIKCGIIFFLFFNYF